MRLRKNTRAGKVNIIFYLLLLFLSIFFISPLYAESNLEGSYTNIKILDKISSKNTLIKLKNGEDLRYKDLSIKSMKCTNSEFDDNPEITAYLQVKDLKNKDKNEVFIFNGWTFSSSPALRPFDHSVYDIWLTKCF